MFLYLKRSQRTSWLGARIYKLTAHIDANPEERRIIHAHGFAEKLAYIVPLHHVEDLERRAEAAYQRQKQLSVFRQEDAGKIVWENTKSVALAIRASVALASAFKVTISELLLGTVIEGTRLNEVLETEASIIKTFDALKRLCDEAFAFEIASEAVLEPDPDPADQLTPPSTWPRFSRS